MYAQCIWQWNVKWVMWRFIPILDHVILNSCSGHYFTLLLKVPVRYCLVTFYSFTKRRRMEFRSTIIEDISIVSRDSYLYWTLCVVTSVLIVSGHIMEAHDEQRSYSWINTVCSAVLFWLIFVHRERWVSCFFNEILSLL